MQAAERLDQLPDAARSIRTDSPDTPARKGSAIWTWLMPRAALAKSRAQWRQRRPSAARHLEAARAAWTLARAALPINDPAEGGRRAIAEMLYGETVRHCLCAMLECDTPGEVEQAINTWSTAELAARAGGLQSAGVMRALFRVPTSPDGTLRADPGPPTGTDALELVAEALLRDGVRRARAYHLLLGAVVLRWLMVALGLAALLGAVFTLSPLRRLVIAENLIAQAHWRVSSVQPGEAVALRGTLSRNPDRPFFFHTALEDSPAIEVEIPGGPKVVSRVVVDNRTDCCGARALPLAVEVSSDHVSWIEVGRRSEPFEHWTARFAPRPTRWIRLRVARPSYLHLRDVAAH